MSTPTNPGTSSASPGAAAVASPGSLPRLGVLYSYEQGEKAAERAMVFARSRGLRIILDSGAWSVFNAGAVIDARAHAAFVNSLAPDYPAARFVALDVIGDPQSSFNNWIEQRELGAPVEPTLHYGEPLEFVDAYVREGLAVNGLGETWFNCGGMVAASSRPSWIRPTMAWVAAVKKRLPPEVKVHGLGMTTPAANNIISFDSVDSTYWLVSYARNRTLPLFDPALRRWLRLTLMTSTAEYQRESKSTFRHAGRLLRERYDTTPELVWGMTEMERLALSIRSHAVFADTYRERHHRPSSPIVYLAGAPSSPTAASGTLMEDIAYWAEPTNEHAA